jgi:hypothetical protein
MTEMRNRLIMIGIATTMVAGGNLCAAPGDAPAEQQSLLSRLRQRNSATRQQVQSEPEQLAQNRGYQPGVTFPQAQQQQPAQQQRPQQPVYPQQAQPYPAYPPQPIAPPVQGTPYNIQGAQQTPATRQQGQSSGSTNQGSSARTRQESNDDSSRPSSSRSRSSSNDSDDDEKSSSRSSSSSSSSKKSDSDDSKKSSSSDEKKSSSKSESSSALEKIAKKVESDESDEKAKKAEKTPEPKKSDEEVAREKAHAAFLKAADEATTVVASFLKQANDGYYSKAADSLSPAIQKYFESEMSAVNGTQKGVLDELTANGTITMVTYINTTVRGEGAVVEAELGYADGRTTRRSFDLIKIDDKWKIVLPVKGVANSTAAPARKAAAAAAAVTPAPTPAAASAPAGAPATEVPLTPEQAAARAVAPLVLAPADGGTTTPQ